MKPTNDLWFSGDSWQQWGALMASPIAQQAFSRVIMANLPVGPVAATAEQEALRGAQMKGFYNFYKELVKLTVLPNIAEDRRPAYELVPDPLNPPDNQ